MKKIYLILLFILFSSISTQAQNKERIAVLKLESVNLSNPDIITLTNRFRSELVKTGVFIVVERSEMAEILKEQGFQMSGCTSDECAVEAGRILSVHQICVGSISKIGSLYSLDVRLIDVETGEILKTVTEDCECPIERVLTHSIQNIALKISGKMIPGSSVTVLSKGTGDIYLKTKPSGADVYIDRKQTSKTTPVTLRKLAVGKHLIEVVKGDLIGTKYVLVNANSIGQETIQLKKAKGIIRIYSDPPEAEIFLGSKNYGTTPRIMKNIDVGTHKLTLMKNGYLKFTKTLQVSPGKEVNIDCNLKQMASLNLQSIPVNAEVFLNNQKEGNTPLTLDVRPGESVNIKIKHADYNTWEDNLALREGQTKEIKAELEKLQGLMQFTSFSKGTLVSINEKTFRLNKKEIRMPVGEYSIEISKPGYISKNLDLIINPDEKTKLNASLDKKTISAALIRSFILPGWGQYYQEKPVFTWLYPIAILGSGTGALIYSFNYTKKVDDYNSIRDQYLNAVDENDIEHLRKQMDDSYSEANSVQNIRNIFIISTVTLWLWNVLDTVILPPKWTNKISLSSNVKNENTMVTFALKFN